MVVGSSWMTCARFPATALVNCVMGRNVVTTLRVGWVGIMDEEDEGELVAQLPRPRAIPVHITIDPAY